MNRIARRQRRCACLIGLIVSLSAAPAGAEEFTGRLDWVQRVMLSTLVSGTVTDVAVRPGQRVDKGAALVRLDSRGFEAAVSEAQARVVSLEEKNAEAQRELERAQELYDRTVLADRDLQLAVIAAAEVEADLRAAEARLVQARLDLEYSVVRAPFTALILDLPARLGQTVITTTESEPLVAIASADSMLARIEVPPAVLDRLQDGASVQVMVGARTYAGQVLHRGLEPSTASGDELRYPVDVSFQPGDDILRAGASARVSW